MQPFMKHMIQVASIVDKCDETVLDVIKDFGLGPWMVYEFNPQNNKDLKLWEKENNTITMRLAVTNIGKLEFEYIEPVSEQSIYAEHLANRGEGLHHLAFDVADYKTAIADVKARGYRNAMSGIWNDGKDWSYLDTEKELKFVAELYEMPPEFGYQDPDTKLPYKYDILDTYSPMFIDCGKVGIVVRDLYETTRTYSEGYGHCDWAIKKYDSTNMTCGEKPCEYSYLSAITKVEGFELELIQPLEGESIFSSRLDSYGEGLYYVNMIPSKNFDTTVQTLKDKGYQIIQQEVKDGKRHAFVGAEKTFKAVIEIIEE